MFNLFRRNKNIFAYSNNSNIKEAVREINKNLNTLNAKAIIYFASYSYNQEELAKAMKEAFKGITTVGVSTIGEIVNNKSLDNSLVALCLTENEVEDIKFSLLENVNGKIDIENVIKEFETYYRTPINEMDINKYVGLVLMEGLSKKEEAIMEKLGDKCDLLFIGGSSADNLTFTGTYVHFEGKVYQNAAVIGLIKTINGYEIVKTQSAKVLDKKFEVTKADEENRIIYELNNKPAAEVYCEALNMSKEELAKKLMNYPFGLVVGEEPYLRSPAQFVDNNGIAFFCNVKEGTILHICESESDKIVERTKNELNKINKKDVKATFVFNCILRKIELSNINQLDNFANLFEEMNAVGFHTYGEQYLGHINQTSTILILK